MTGLSKFFIGFALVVLVVLVVVGGVVFLSFKVSGDGERDSRWIREGMWKGGYFNRSRGRLDEDEVVNIVSLKEGASKNQGLLNYVGSKKCALGGAGCVFKTLTAANVLIDAAEFENALRLLEGVRRQVDLEGLCPIGLELSLLNYKVAQLTKMSSQKAISEAESTVERIKERGGLVKDLRVSSCDAMARDKPEFFHEYVVLVSKVMRMGGARLFKSGYYVKSINKLDY
ncbi:hypothetical protein [Pseudomonas sp. SCB32]|uniref:hypothetical protein n=1 Tax=Pseudomonas sp. SCB32 TaxID=2653853 RepID=UPI0012654296|nr:hypothetical protein [Pseudomonas sp. SCB32]